MAERGQIPGGDRRRAAGYGQRHRHGGGGSKGIVSLVAGHADILIAPNLEAGNMLAKELTFVAQAEAAGLVLGAGAAYSDEPRRR